MVRGWQTVHFVALFLLLALLLSLFSSPSSRDPLFRLLSANLANFARRHKQLHILAAVLLRIIVRNSTFSIHFHSPRPRRHWHSSLNSQHQCKQQQQQQFWGHLGQQSSLLLSAALGVCCIGDVRFGHMLIRWCSRAFCTWYASLIALASAAAR